MTPPRDRGGLNFLDPIGTFRYGACHHEEERMIARFLAIGCALLAIAGLTPMPAGAARAGRTNVLDLHHLPLGDGKISNAPRKGYVFACQQGFMPGRGGAEANVPWIHGRTWDLTEKPHVRGRVLWPQA
jgi:hypothetical protein